jgi:hypothetical protein
LGSKQAHFGWNFLVGAPELFPDPGRLQRQEREAVPMNHGRDAFRQIHAKPALAIKQDPASDRRSFL